MPTPAGGTKLDISTFQIPHHFRCPISLDLMLDPVTVPTGQTYDRPSIESWTSHGHATCPVTRLPLPPDLSLTPNHTLRRLIQNWCVALGLDRIPTPNQPPSPSSLRSLVSRSSAGDLAALRRLKSLAEESDHTRSLLSTPETRAALIATAFSRLHPSSVSAEALSLLASLPFKDADSHLIVGDPDRLSYLAALVSSYTCPAELRISTAAVLESASRSTESRLLVGASDGVMDGLVMLLADDKLSDSAAARVGIRGLFALCLAKENRVRAVLAGAAGAVMARLDGIRDVELLVRALATVELLCRVEEGREAVAAVEGAAGILVRAMAAGKERAAEHAAGALVAVVGGSVDVAMEAAGAGAVAQLLLMVQGGCSDRAKRKAQVLLKMLRPAWARYETVANSDDYYYFQQS